MTHQWFALLILLPWIAGLAAGGELGDTLQLVHVLFRHGEKTPEASGLYPRDPYRNETWYPYGPGALTKRGMAQAYELGAALRGRYDSYLGKVYASGALDAWTTSFDRTKMSLQLVLAGLWPPTTAQTWSKRLPWIPVPYSYEPMSRDKLLKFALSYCPKYREQYKKFANLDDNKKFLTSNAHLINYINNHTGLNCTSIWDLYILYLALYAEDHLGLKLPEWTKEVYPDFLEKAAILEYQIQTYSDEMLKAAGGYLIQKIIEDATSKQRNTIIPKERKMFIYSGHEFNIVYMLAALKVDIKQVPPHTAYVLCEFHKINQQYGFKIFYQDYSEKEPRLLTVPGCEEFCLIENFIRLTKNVMPKDDTC